MATETKVKTYPLATEESSLTAPDDRDHSKRWKAQPCESPLSTEETDAAIQELSNKDAIFRKVERSYADPPMREQVLGLISFLPAKGATPNKNGIYGFAKLRGNYPTLSETDARSEFLIRNHDSYNQIMTCYVGRPFPITSSRKFSEDVREVDIRKEAAETMGEAIKRQTRKDEREIKEIKERERLLREDVKKTKKDPYDVYITSRVKKAQLVWTYNEHLKKMAEVKELIIKTRVDIAKLDEEHPDFKNTYLEKYTQARVDAGLKESTEESQNNFMKYLAEDIEDGLDF
ncbi:MAG: hypothetical protein MKZ63_07095 [Nitrospinales bacterium]|nr:hypothetical protein [Nitrospinales bacterium]